MAEEQPFDVQSEVDRVVEMEEELEISGLASVDADKLASTKAKLHDWVESVTAAVATPGLGRVTLIHTNGNKSTITSPELPFVLSGPLGDYQEKK